MSSSEGRILGVVGAEGSGAGLRLLFRWAEGQPPESLPARVVQALWPSHALAFYQHRVSTPTQPHASKEGPSEAKTAASGHQHKKASTDARSETATEPGHSEVKEEPAPEPHAPPKTQTQPAAAKKPPGRPKKRALTTGGEEPPAKKAKAASASRQSFPPPGPSEERSLSPESLVKRAGARACRLAAKAYADWGSGEEDEEDQASDDEDSEDDEEEEEGDSEEEEEEEGRRPKESSGEPKFGFPSMVRAVLAECEGEEKTRGLHRDTIVERLQRRFRIAIGRNRLIQGTRSGLRSLLRESLVVMEAGCGLAHGPFVLTPLGREEWRMKRFVKQPSRLGGSGTLRCPLGPVVKAALEREPGGVLFKDLLSRLKEHLKGSGRQLRKPATRGQDVANYKLRRFVGEQMVIGGLVVGAGGDAKEGPFLPGPKALVKARPGHSALARRGMAAVDGPQGFTLKQLHAWTKASSHRDSSSKDLDRIRDMGRKVVLRDFARGLLTLAHGGDPCDGPFRLTHR